MYILEDIERTGGVMEITTWKAEMKMTRRTYPKAFASAPYSINNYRVIYVDDAACNGSTLSSIESIGWPREMAYVTGPTLLVADADGRRRCKQSAKLRGGLEK